MKYSNRISSETTRSVTHYKVRHSLRWTYYDYIIKLHTCISIGTMVRCGWLFCNLGSRKYIPANLIKEFEEYTKLEVERISTRSMGQTCNILNVVKSDSTKPQVKKCKVDRDTISADDG